MIRWWHSLSFNRQAFFIMTAAACTAFMLFEFFFEPTMENIFKTPVGGIDWQETPLWLLTSLVAGAGLATVFVRSVVRKLERIIQATEEIRRGNFAIRIPTFSESGDVFNRLSLSFNAMSETIDMLLQSERRLLSDISHEIRSPLARVSAAVELLLMQNPDNASTAYLEKTQKELVHMDHLVDTLLEKSRNRLSVRKGRTKIDLSATVAEITDSFQMQGIVEKKKIQAKIDKGIHVEGHPMQVQLIIENLLSNALTYTPVDGLVQLYLRSDSGVTQLTVRDHGPGVPEDQLDLIFEPFYRAVPSRKSEGGGIGLGLTLVREACQALDGSVRAKNAQPGLEVTVLLPLSR